MGKYVRQTSKDAYKAIRQSGLLSKKRWEVYNFIYENGPTYGPEISKHIPGGHKRVSELIELGVVMETGAFRKNPQTNQTVFEVDVTSQLPSGKVGAAAGRKGVKALRQDVASLLKAGESVESALQNELEDMEEHDRHPEAQKLYKRILKRWCAAKRAASRDME